MRSHDDRFAAELSEARGIIDALRADGAGTRALELELSRARRAASEEHWDEAERRIERVLSAGTRVPAAAPPAPVPVERVEEKLANARRRIDVLKRLGLDVSGMEEAAARAEAFAASSYPASAESIVDELLVLTKAAAEGVRTLAHAGKPGAPPATPSGDDFIGVLRTAVTEIAEARGWMTEERARALLGEVLPKLFLLERHVAEQVHRCAADAAKDLATTRAELAGSVAERAAALDASLRALREETVPVLSRARDGVAAADARAAAALAAAERAAGEGAEATRRVATDLAEQSRALAVLAEEVRALAKRGDGFAEIRDVDALASALAEARERLDACAGRKDVERVDSAIAGARSAIAAQEEAHRTLANSARADARAASEAIAELSKRLGDAVDEQGQVLVQIEASIDEQRRKLAGLSGGADAAAVSALASGQEEARKRLASLEQRIGTIDLDSLRAAVAQANARITEVESRPSGDVEPLKAAVAEAVARVAEVERRQANAAASGAAAVERIEAEMRALSERHDAAGRRIDAVARDVDTRAPDEVVTAIAGGLDSLRGALASLEDRMRGADRAGAVAEALEALKRADAERAEAVAELSRRLADRPAVDVALAPEALDEVKREAQATRERVETLAKDVARRPTAAALDELRRALVEELARHPTDESLDELRRADVALQQRIDALARDPAPRADVDETAALRDRIESLARDAAALRERVESAPRDAVGGDALRALSDRVESLARDASAGDALRALNDRVESLARDSSAGDALRALNDRVEAVARDAAARSELEALRARVESSAGDAVARGDVDQLRQRVEALAAAAVARADLEALRERIDAAARDAAARGAAPDAEIAALRERVEALAREVATAPSAASLAELRGAVEAATKAAKDADERRGSLAVHVATLARVVHDRASSERVEAVAGDVAKAREAMRALEARADALAASLDEGLRVAATPTADDAALRSRLDAIERHFADDGDFLKLAATVKGLRASGAVSDTKEPTPPGGRSSGDMRGIVDLLLREAQVAAKSVGELREQVAAMAQKPPAAAEPDHRVDALLARLDAVERTSSSAAATSAVDALATRLGMLESRLDVIERRADERTMAILGRIDELTAASAAGGSAPVSAGDLDERVARRVMERLGGEGARVDLAALRKAMPDLIAAPEIGRMIVNTLLVDALQRGGDSPLRKLLRAEIAATGVRDGTTIEPRIAVETRVPFDIPSPPLAALDRRDGSTTSVAPAKRASDMHLGSDAVAETGSIRNEVAIKPKTEVVAPARREAIKVSIASEPAKPVVAPVKVDAKPAIAPAKAAEPAKPVAKPGVRPDAVIEPFAPRKRP